MRCPSCGTLHDFSAECRTESITEVSTSEGATDALSCDDSDSEPQLSEQSENRTTATSRLIEFPGTRNSVPVWRKEIAERVREAQERKARESASKDDGAAPPDSPTPQLELLPPTEPPPVNPLVIAALKRIERAHADPSEPATQGRRAVAAVAYATGYEPTVEAASHSAHSVSLSPVLNTDEDTNVLEQTEEPARTPNLVVVPSTSIHSSETRTETTRATPRKVLSDEINNPALNYIDTVPTTSRYQATMNTASAVGRIVAGLLDVIVLALLYSPIAVSLELFRAGALGLQVWFLAVGAFCLIGFFFFTVSIGLTGRTIGMRLLGLRVVDIRTGLIPTGSQSARRSLLYLLSLLSAGVPFLGLVFDSDHRMPHERFSQTIVVKA
jgi:uncharacterized RDD family membrane protein YckC